MYLDQYKIEGTINNDQNPCFHDETTYPQFQEELEEFKDLLKKLVDLNQSRTFYKFGDGDYYFLNKCHHLNLYHPLLLILLLDSLFRYQHFHLKKLFLYLL